MRALLIAVLSMAMSSAAFAADTLERVRETGSLRLGFRADAPPYSYRAANGDPSGYIVDLCREVATGVKNAQNIPSLKIDYIEVTSRTRFEALRDGKIDILCDPTSMTMSRRAVVDFSLPTFIDGAGVLHRVNDVHRLEDLRGKKIGALQGTTTEETLRTTLAQLGIEAEIVPMTDHPSGVRQLTEGKIDAYFADRGILNYHLLNSRNPAGLKLSDQYFTFETYALALPRGDDKLRLLADATLAELYRTDRVKKIYARSFGSFPPDQFIKALFVINGVPK
ncbi:MAG: amino acid ABC transporter substrate-binding protein [Chelatococcus sp.]|jgi:ABC-type amino acid transport substrate-binding protein|uniref:amino acid ABC transporter substrate-binding protein n=1 Tax=unclassified Chelatococcus TaxID=2638111 RepID=UPI001BCB7B42|nr:MULTISPECIES: amino acid ABC transporter substrate-binding protein [unclassified Chelatococcus]CAH1649711.1 Amino acid ABC transporter substrate-binding protein (PAAT family) [Hyphomicrobiales bacterium]MBS7739638.1 amino acid ABC transporter substrate-binding protein [Chelatococcus sp. HY11]MBX3537642.1 amino acid ABC transporter substrate-binding protein [Chelatococcus sp.]MBX3544007.1 amino acid ABC transporter substrate-binding protein [Chelatococcus sp.]MCO5075825.1 amino acid ABC tran